MNLATIPLPTTRTGVTITEHDSVLPDAPECTTGVVYAEKSGRTTVQCSVCLRCATGVRPQAPIMFAGWAFYPDEGETGHTRHRRCPDCRAARKHP